MRINPYPALPSTAPKYQVKQQPDRIPHRIPDEGMEPDDLLCSRNARPQKTLVGRAQEKINQPQSLKKERANLEGARINGEIDRII